MQAEECKDNYAHHTRIKRTQEIVLSSFYFIQEIISGLKSDDDNIINFNRVLRALGFYIAGHTPDKRTKNREK